MKVRSLGSIVFVLSLMFGLLGSDSYAQGQFVITSPPAGSVLAPGQSINILWTGGDPNWTVGVFLIELTSGFPFAAVATAASNISNSGSVANWPIPSHIDYGAFHYDTCGHTYQFNVQEHSFPTLGWTYGPIFSVACGTAVSIDIKPGGFPNSINPRSQGVIPVAVITTPTFDARTVNPETATFGRNASVPAQSALEDVDNDGDLDLILHFRIQETGIGCGDTAASLAGKTYAGQSIKGSDSLSTVGCK